MPQQLPTGTHIARVTLAVADLDRSLGFYRDLAGLREMGRAANSVLLGTGNTAIIELIEERGALPPPPRATGLYHTAILYPDRAALAGIVRHVAARNYPFTGASDHLVSEAFYLDDPDGLGVELYRDRPRSEWRWHGTTIEMASLPLDVDDLLKDAPRPLEAAPPGTRVGHVHLRVSDIADAEAFYGGELGFDVMARFGSAATFLAADGYHHHIGANMWQSRGGAPPPAGHAGLRRIIVQAPGRPRTEHTDPWGHGITVGDVTP
jgi:catechol 2,3-dioxygenase